MQHKVSRFIPFILFPLYFLLVAPSPAHAQYLASDLLGQLDANDQPIYTASSTNNGESVPSARGMSAGVRQPAIDFIHHRLFFADYNSPNSRVLVFNLDENNNLIDRVADNVLGQASLSTSTLATVTQASLYSPSAIEYDPVRDYLFVSQADANRVSVFDVASITDGENAIYVLGQPTFTSSTATTTQSGMSFPIGLAYDSSRSRLFVGERFNNRVLVFDVSTMSNGMNASYVLGQSTFTSSTAATTQSGMFEASGMDFDATNNRLFVFDRSNQRVLVFDLSSGITNGMNASYVLGQPNFTTSGAAVTQSGFSTSISDVKYDNATGKLFVAEGNNRRVMIFNASPTTISNGASAVAVLGHANFTTNTDNIYSQSGLPNASGLIYDPNNNRLYVSGSKRVSIFNFVRMSTSSLASARADASYSISLSSSNSQGTVSYATTSGSLPPGLTLATSTGIISGTPTLMGTYTFTIQATDNNGSIGYFVSQPQSYSITVGPAATVTVGNNNYAPAPQPAPAPVVATPVIQLTPTTPTQPPTLTLPPVTIGSPVFVPLSFSFTQNLKPADKKSDVQTLQQYLNSQGFAIAETGPGSPGNETNFFGSFTKQALIKFQEAHKDQILTPVGLTKGTGYFGPLTRAFVNGR